MHLSLITWKRQGRKDFSFAISCSVCGLQWCWVKKDAASEAILESSKEADAGWEDRILVLRLSAEAGALQRNFEVAANQQACLRAAVEKEKRNLHPLHWLTNLPHRSSPSLSFSPSLPLATHRHSLCPSRIPA